ncbi:MAG TPA: hypothetical protein PLP11_07420 [Bacteroidales bacterium]|nr:hypothetical protein [Bacteroidales bacterium]
MRTYSAIVAEIKASYIENETVRARYSITNPAATFDSTFSRFSIESIWAGVVAMAIYTVEVLVARHAEEVSSREDAMRIGTTEWWRRVCKAFQYGDDLVYNGETNVYEYAEIDESARIIQFAEVREGEGPGIQILVNAADGDGNPEALPVGDERTAFNAYLSRVKIAGIPVSWGSYNPDKLKIALHVKYNPLVLDSNGQLIGGIITPVSVGIEQYLRNLQYGSGVINKTALIDAVQSAEGVVDVYAVTADWLQVSTDSSPSYATVAGQDCLSYGGAFMLDQLNVIYYV